MIDQNEEIIERFKTQVANQITSTFAPTMAPFNQNDQDDNIPLLLPSSYIHVRMVNYSPLTKVRLIKANSYGESITE